MMNYLDQTINFFEKIHRHSESVHWFSSPDFNIIYHVSPAYETIWSRPRQELYKNPEIWINHIHPDDFKDYHPIHEMAKRVTRENTNARYNESYRIILPNGEVRWILDQGHPICDEKKNCIGVIGVATDVTYLRDIELIKNDSSYVQYVYHIFPEILQRISDSKNKKQIYIEISSNKIEISKREIECLFAILKGKTIKQIAREFCRSPRTVEHHIERIKFKFKCRTRSELIEKVLSSQIA